MKKRSFFRRALCLALTLCIGLATLTVVVSAEETDTPSGSELVNKYNRSSPAAKIAVNAGDVVYFGPAICWGSSVHMKAWSATGSTATLVTNITPSTEGVAIVDTFGYYNIYSYTVPEGVAAVCVNDTRIYPLIYTVTVNQKLTKKNFNEYWEAKNARVLTSHGKSFAPKTTSVLNGKSVIFMGDSITHASRDESTYYHGWAGRIGEINGMDWVNAGQDGASVSTAYPDNRVISQMDSYLDREFDYVIMHGGVNDAWQSAPIGAISDSQNPEDFDVDTFAGALEELFYTAKKNYPNATHGYIINFEIRDLNEGKLAEFEGYANEAIKICDKWGVQYLDLYHDTDFCENVLKVNTADYLPDHVHPNGQGYDLLYPKLEAWMISITPEEPETTVAPETTAPDTSAAPETTAEASGCGSVLSPMATALTTLCLGGAALLLRKRKIFES